MYYLLILCILGISAYRKYQIEQEKMSLMYPSSIFNSGHGLYLSNWENSVNEQLLIKNNIKTIICLNLENQKTLEQLLMYQIHGIDHWYFTIPDHPHAPIKLLFNKCQDIIDAGLQKGSVLVHCTAGVSRSATIVCNYLSKKLNKSPLEVLDDMRQTRPIVNPNPGFMAQLTASLG
jgi:protein-tyrosine phosphatase